MAVDSSLPLALWVIPVGNFGGVARHVTDVARAGLPGYRLVVLAPAGALIAKLKELGTEVIEGEFGTEAGFSRSFKTLDGLINDLQPAVVHSHLAYADIVAAAVVNARKIHKLVKPSLHVPLLVTTEHGIAGNDSVYHSSKLKAKGRELIHRLRLMATDRKIAVSHSTAEQMRLKWGARKVQVIHNGIDADAVAAAVRAHRVESAVEGPRILSLSRLAPEKGLDVLISAFALVREKYPDSTLEVAGEGELLGKLQEQVRKLGLEEAVIFSGFVDSAEAMGRNDMLVQLSVWENLSYTLLDAKAAGLSILATDVGGNSEILFSEQLICNIHVGEKKTATQEVADKLIKLNSLSSPVLKKKDSPYTIETMISALIQVYSGKRGK